MAGGSALSVVPKRARLGPLTESLQVRIDTDTRRRIESIVAETGQHISEVIRLLLLAGIEAHEGRPKR